MLDLPTPADPVNAHVIMLHFTLPIFMASSRSFLASSSDNVSIVKTSQGGKISYSTSMCLLRIAYIYRHLVTISHKLDYISWI